MPKKVNYLSQTRFAALRIALIPVGFCVALTLRAEAPAEPKASSLGYRVVQEYPHDVRHFTQGLEIHEGKLYESVGGYGRSGLLIKELRSGKLIRGAALQPQFFGEGLTVLADRILLLTWREGVGFILGQDLKARGQFELRGEGWGLTRMPGSRGQRLVLSDGSSVLQLLDPQTYVATGTLPVRDGAEPVERLNELEYAKGEIYANVWMSDRIAVIGTGDGRVRAWLDLSGLLDRFPKPPGWQADEHVLNGIAYDEATDHFFVTGKCWPRLFEIQLDTTGKPEDAPSPSGPE